MPHFLDILNSLTDLSVWIKIVLFVFVLTLVIYLICSLFQEKFVLATSVENNKTNPVSADQIYYLPTASLVITAMAKVVVASNPSGNIEWVRLTSLKLENDVVFEPDTSQLYLLNYKPSVFSNDELRLNTNANGLLETINSSVQDVLPAIIAELSEGPQKILTDSRTKGIVRIQPENESVAPVTVQTVEFVNKFFIGLEELLSDKLSRSWIISIDGNQLKPMMVDASFEITKPKLDAKHYENPSPVHGVFTRPLKKIKLDLKITNPQFNQQDPVCYEITIPDVTSIINIPISRAAFVKKVQSPRFINGLLVENYINKPSQADGFVSIPINILKAIFSIPAQLLGFRIFHIQKETELEKAKLELSAAREQMARLTSAQKEFDATTNKLKGVSDQLNQQTKDLSSVVKRGQSQDKQSGIVDGKILIEAIDAFDEKWKAEYGVLDISVGKKKVNGFETAINALVFKPMEKLEEGQGNFVPIPPCFTF